MLVKDAMPLVTEARIHPSDTLRTAAAAMIRHRVDALPVLEDDHLVGVIRLTDLISAPIPARYHGHIAEGRDETQLVEMWGIVPVRNIMNVQVLSVSEDMSLMKAAALMVNDGKQGLLVVRANEVVGMITRADVVKALLTLSQT